MIRTRLSLVCAALLTLAACAVAPPAAVGDRPPATSSTPATTPTPSIVERADRTLTVIEARAERLSTIVDLVVVLLPPEQQLAVRVGQAAASQALAAARAAVTIADQVAQLRRARAELDRIDRVTGVPTEPIAAAAPAGAAT